MNPKSATSETQNCWFVGASYDGNNDQTARFLREGIWENGYQDRYLSSVKSIQVGDRIAIKSAYTRKNHLPFDNRGQAVSVMAIKAIGTVKKNLGDGRILQVEWRPVEPPREWYFYTHRATIWKVQPGNWKTDALIAFAFDQKSQNIKLFRNAPYWKERFGDGPEEDQRFVWTRFFRDIADKLIAFKADRTPLVAELHAIAKRVDRMPKLKDVFMDGTTGPLKDICPFTLIGTFNRGITETNRKNIAVELAKFLGVTEPVPTSFEGIPVLNNQRSWFFGFEKDRRPDDIDALWGVFAEALRFADSDEADARSAFIAAYDNVIQRYGVGWNLTMGLYWIRPWDFPTLDGQSRNYITKKLGMEIGSSSPKGYCSADDYLSILEKLEARFQEEAYPVHSFPELSLAAWQFEDVGTPQPPEPPELNGEDTDTDAEPETVATAAPAERYSVDHILNDGCFIERAKLDKMLERLRTKKNLILQGPPGTGKTWLAKRLGFALMGERNENKLRSVQFHPNLSYEDFVRGWRPAGDGKLALVDGPFLEVVKAAAKEPTAKYVMVIEEINRGNPAQILGEMLTLLEADKRTPSEALELCYRRTDGERVFIPDNLYVIGTMNIADRSIALVDLALRRRFAFIDLEPTLGKPWHDWVHTRCNIPLATLLDIEKRLLSLNEDIAADKRLGQQFRIGHSFVTPPFGIPINDASEWFRHVVETEIGPLLEEYWFDDPEKARKARIRLLEGF